MKKQKPEKNPNESIKSVDVVKVVTENIMPLIADAGLELWSVEFVKRAGEWFLVITLDKDGGITMDDCMKAHKLIDPKIDELDPIPGSFTMEISSPGINRELKTENHILKYLNTPVTVKLYAKDEKMNVKQFDAVLADYKENTVTVEIDGDFISYPKKAIAHIYLNDMGDM